eukprot:GFUD01031559.1.p1 GENE.GFUD01031559.1~~GFUD01031559.1.p1  ORF type:complete len:347 (+),score=101.65 GFUD01031559.1:54-1043(+)
MKIFLQDMNFGGQNIYLEVEIGDTIAVVKRKLQDKHKGIGVENQVLSLGWKRLQDNNTLEDYNIQPFSNLELSYKRSLPPGDERDDDMAKKEDDWDAIASAAKKNFDKEVGEKKMLYSKLKDKKTNIESQIKHDAIYLDDYQKELDCTEQEIDNSRSKINKKKQEVRELEKLISKDLKKKMELKTSINQKRSTREIRRKQIMCLNTHIEKLETDTKQLFNDVGGQNKKLLEENIKIKDEKSALKTFLSESVEQKESLLECPVCFYTACPPISKCPSDHLICHKCLPRMNGKCPTCRTKYAWVKGSVTRARLAEQNYEELQKIKAKLDAM